ncbi:hypothetical protein BN11_2200003 [Nostocoides australiense Ben110]|uniref:ABC transporter domain-containing protein n=1 Tax=Nostocoides australiense Ben110 TaxID=1193182 RepID=W6JWI0_9MICO|nr:hypothetical protein BN11_2200003 [Tetrasphaera australiensis Ben110]
MADRTVGKCSGGEQQRLRFAMSLISDPELILLDEPTTGMDVASRRAFWENIHADARAGRTVVFATHHLEEADQYADRVVLVRKGQIVADGTARPVGARHLARRERGRPARHTRRRIRRHPRRHGDHPRRGLRRRRPPPADRYPRPGPGDHRPRPRRRLCRPDRRRRRRRHRTGALR